MRLHIESFSTQQFKLLPKETKRWVTRKIEATVLDNRDGFFYYTRDNSWIQDAVGDQGDWIKINGMALWHIVSALFSLESSSDRTNTPPYPPPSWAG
jgi:hypothetical protein